MCTFLTKSLEKSGRLDALQEQARLTQQIEVQCLGRPQVSPVPGSAGVCPGVRKAYHNERKLAKLTNKKDGCFGLGGAF